MTTRRSTEALVEITAPIAGESALTRYVVTPFLFISFLVSLFVVEQRAHDTIFASPHSHARRHSDTREGEVGPHQKALEDFYHSHQRKLAKQEFAEAFEMRNKVIGGIVLAGGLGVAAVSWGWMKVWSIWSQ